MLDTSRDAIFVGEVPRSARDDRVCRVVVASKTSVARRHFIFAMRARPQWKTTARYAQCRPEISDLDAAARNFTGLDQRDVALRRQVLRPASRRESDRIGAL